jgi:hypothetical protein
MRHRPLAYRLNQVYKHRPLPDKCRPLPDKHRRAYQGNNQAHQHLALPANRRLAHLESHRLELLPELPSRRL